MYKLTRSVRSVCGSYTVNVKITFFYSYNKDNDCLKYVIALNAISEAY